MSNAKALKKAPDLRRKSGVKGFFSNNLYIILAFAVPFVIMTSAFALMSVAPFGNKQILVVDLWHQYYPFLADFQDKLKHGESLFWSWTQGGGVNYFALMSYYLASPLNFLSVFVPSEWLREFLMFSVAIKIALAGMFTAIFIRSMYKVHDFSLVVFGCCFSFCAFFMGYYWNTIWLDTVCLTPLVALGAVKLFTEGRFRLYVVTLALSLLANYYIGLFTCIFVFLMFVAYSIVKWGGIKDFFTKLLRTGVFSLIAIGLTAFFLLPAFFGLQNTNATGSTFPNNFDINIGATDDLMGVLAAMKDISSNMLSFISPATKEADALPNIACGAATIVLAILFLTSKKISVREKIVDVCLVLFMMISCVIRQLDYIWHGFHFTNMIPYRFSYLISFVLVIMAFRAYMLLDFSSRWDVIVAGLATAALILLAIGKQDAKTIVGTAVICLVLCVMLFMFTGRIIPKQAVLIVLSVMVLAESAVTAYVGVKTTSVTDKSGYPSGEENTEQLINYMNEVEKDTTELWRAETTSTQTLNDGSLNHYNGLSMFNSMANVDITRFFENFGMKGWKSGNRYTYVESSPVTNMFMNLKYIISRDGNFRNTYDLTQVYSSSYERLLKNEHYIPMGFMVKSDLLEWREDDREDQFNPFDRQNEFFRLATGIEENVYTALQVVSQGHFDSSKFTVNKTSYGNYSFSCTDASITPYVKWNYEAPKDGLYCMYAKISGGDNVTVMVNDEAQPSTYGMDRPYIACIGEFRKGDKISVYAQLELGQAGSAQVYVNLLNQDVFEQGYEILSKDVMKTETLSQSSMTGTISVTEPGLFYTSIPYENGWSAFVDGEEVEITPVGKYLATESVNPNEPPKQTLKGGSLLAFELGSGTHKIELRYYPKGFWPGFAVTVVCLGTFIFLCVYIYIIKKRKTKASAESENAEKTVKK